MDVAVPVVDGGDVNQFVPSLSLEKLDVSLPLVYRGDVNQVVLSISFEKLERLFKNVGAGFSLFDDTVGTALELPLSRSMRL